MLGFEDLNNEFASCEKNDQTIDPMSTMALCVLNAFNK